MFTPKGKFTYYVPVPKGSDHVPVAKLLNESPWFEKLQTISEKIEDDDYDRVFQITIVPYFKDEKKIEVVKQ